MSGMEKFYLYIKIDGMQWFTEGIMILNHDNFKAPYWDLYGTGTLPELLRKTIPYYKHTEGKIDIKCYIEDNYIYQFSDLELMFPEEFI